MLSDKLLKIAEEIEVLEAKLSNMEDLIQANRELENENGYMRDLLYQFGVEDIWGDLTTHSLSVADVMALEKAVRAVWEA